MVLLVQKHSSTKTKILSIMTCNYFIQKCEAEDPVGPVIFKSTTTFPHLFMRTFGKTDNRVGHGS